MEQHQRSERGADYYIYLDPILLDDDNKTLNDYNVKDMELLHL